MSDERTTLGAEFTQAWLARTLDALGVRSLSSVTSVQCTGGDARVCPEMVRYAARVLPHLQRYLYTRHSALYRKLTREHHVAQALQTTLFYQCSSIEVVWRVELSERTQVAVVSRAGGGGSGQQVSSHHDGFHSVYLLQSALQSEHTMTRHMDSALAHMFSLGGVQDCRDIRSFLYDISPTLTGESSYATVDDYYSLDALPESEVRWAVTQPVTLESISESNQDDTPGSAPESTPGASKSGKSLQKQEASSEAVAPPSWPPTIVSAYSLRQPVQAGERSGSGEGGAAPSVGVKEESAAGGGHEPAVDEMTPIFQRRPGSSGSGTVEVVEPLPVEGRLENTNRRYFFEIPTSELSCEELDVSRVDMSGSTLRAGVRAGGGGTRYQAAHIHSSYQSTPHSPHTNTSLTALARKFGVGWLGERVVVNYLNSLHSYPGFWPPAGRIVRVNWLNESEEQMSPYDISVDVTTSAGGGGGTVTIYIEVKSTSHDDKHVFPIGLPQVQLAVERGERYEIFRVYNVCEGSKVRVVRIANVAEKMRCRELKLCLFI